MELTNRDRFAAVALQGILQSDIWKAYVNLEGPNDSAENLKPLALLAYKVADAMILVKTEQHGIAGGAPSGPGLGGISSI